MKKIAFLSALALLALASCTEKDEPRPEVPNEPIQTVLPIADNVTLNAPAQVGDYTSEGTGLCRYKYSNGQEVVYKLTTDNTLGFIAQIVRIEGSSKDVIIPATVPAKASSTGEMEDWWVVGLNLFYEGVSENVKSITLPKTAAYMVTAAGARPVTAAWFATQLDVARSLENLELEDGFPGFCSVGGAVYSTDFGTLAGVPKAKKGTFTVVDGCAVIGDNAFTHCSELTVITFPISVEEIGSNAVTFTDNLLLINMLPMMAPAAAEDAFGKFAYEAEFRIQKGSKATYFVEKPNLQRPVEPVEPELDASDEEWDAYDEAMGQYITDKEAYDLAMTEYETHLAYKGFQNIKEVQF